MVTWRRLAVAASPCRMTVRSGEKACESWCAKCASTGLTSTTNRSPPPDAMRPKLVSGVRLASQDAGDSDLGGRYDLVTFFETLHDQVPEWYIDDRVQDGLKMPAHMWREALKGLVRAEPPTQMGTITAPTLIVWGDRDELLTYEDEQALTAAIPASRLLVYENTGHLILWEQPERVASDLVEAGEPSQGLPYPNGVAGVGQPIDLLSEGWSPQQRAGSPTRTTPPRASAWRWLLAGRRTRRWRTHQHCRGHAKFIHERGDVVGKVLKEVSGLGLVSLAVTTLVHGNTRSLGAAVEEADRRSVGTRPTHAAARPRSRTKPRAPHRGE